MKTYVLCLCLFFASLGAEEKWVVGTTSGYAPYVSLNAQGDYEGFDIDIARLVAQKLGKTLVLKDCGSMPALLLALKQKKVDTLIWAIDMTQERMEKMEMIYYQGEKKKSIAFLFWKEIPENLLSLESFAANSKNKIAVESGTSQEGILRKIPNMPLVYKDSIADALLEVRYGKALAMPVDPWLVSRFTAQFPELKMRTFPLPPEDQILGNGICLRKEDQELAVQVRKAVEALRSSGEIGDLEKKWGL